MRFSDPKSVQYWSLYQKYQTLVWSIGIYGRKLVGQADSTGLSDWHVLNDDVDECTSHIFFTMFCICRNVSCRPVLISELHHFNPNFPSQKKINKPAASGVFVNILKLVQKCSFVLLYVVLVLQACFVGKVLSLCSIWNQKSVYLKLLLKKGKKSSTIFC